MSSTACLHIHVLDIDHSDSISRNDTPLIQIESMLRLSLFFAFKVLMNRMAFQNYSISLVLYLHLHLLRNRGIVSYVKMSIILCLFCTILPNMRTKNASRSSVYNMCASVKSSQSISTLYIYLSINLQSNCILIYLMIKIV